jgi:hypothetical protein
LPSFALARLGERNDPSKRRALTTSLNASILDAISFVLNSDASLAYSELNASLPTDVRRGCRDIRKVIQTCLAATLRRYKQTQLRQS